MKKNVLLISSMVFLLMLFVQADMLAQVNKQDKKPTVEKMVEKPSCQNVPEKLSPTRIKKTKSVADRKEKLKPGDKPNSKIPISPYADVKPNAGIPLGVEAPRPGKVKDQ